MRPRLHAHAMALATAAALLCAACGAAAEPAAAPQAGLVVVVGNHANAPRPQYVDEVTELIREAVRRQARVGVVAAGGIPRSVVDTFRLTAKNAETKHDQINGNLRTVKRWLDTARPDGPEVDLLAALSVAGRQVAGLQGGKVVVVVDSGLQTAGALRFQEPGMLSAEPADVVKYLAAHEELPDLRGVTVYFSGLGDTAAPQEPLTIAQRSNLVAIWTSVAQAADATVKVLPQPLSGTSVAGLPPVTPVRLPDPPALPTAATRVELTQQTVAFRPDSAEYLDPAAVHEALRPLAARIVETRAAVTITGTTASPGTPEGRRRLSLKRADAVKRTLVALGVPEPRITTRGVGSNWPGFIPDTDAAGNLIPAVAARNRKVILDIA